MRRCVQTFGLYCIYICDSRGGEYTKLDQSSFKEHIKTLLVWKLEQYMQYKTLNLSGILN